MTWNDLGIGQSACILTAGGEGSLRRHFLDMGLVPGASVTLVGYAPAGDPMRLRLAGGDIVLRREDAERIGIGAAAPQKTDPAGRMRPRETGDPIPRDAPLSFALVGNPNSGKTTLFNRLTGMNRHAGNLPGVTVDQKSGAVRGVPNVSVTDLPGIYSLSPYSAEERVARDFLLNEKPSAVIHIADAGNLLRSLALTLQLTALEIPVILALNMMDEVRARGGRIDTETLETLLQIPVVPVSAVKNEGVDDLIRRAVSAVRAGIRPPVWEPAGAVGHAIRALLPNLGGTDLPPRFLAEKLLEGDRGLITRAGLSNAQADAAETRIRRMEEECGQDRAAAVAEARFSFLRTVLDRTATLPPPRRGVGIDRILTGKYTAIPVFVLLMAAVFFLTFHLVGPWLQGILDAGIGFCAARTEALLLRLAVHPTIRSLIMDGVIGGVGSVLSFVPIIVVLFFFLSLLEDSGYLARAAFFMDRPMRRLGLSGRSIVPLLIGFGCTVPAVMACRTLPSEADRRRTILLTPFMSCTAKLPIYGFFAHAFFPAYAGVVTVGLYALGIGMGLLTARISGTGDAAPFVTELPPYRMPTAKNTGRLLWDRAKEFLQRAFTVIFVCSVTVWVLQTFDFRLHTVTDPGQSILGVLAGCAAPLFRLHGFGDWRIVTALVVGFLAKEGVVSTLSVLAGGSAGVSALLTPTAAASLLVFCLLYTPCAAAIAAIRREAGGKRALGIAALQCGIAYLAALLVALTGAVV